ncbi:MAG: class I SAM-dependent methyltransferase [Gemmatimonadaceae bacterium]
MLRALRKTWGSLRSRGVVATAGILATTAIDLWYDVRRGTRTSGWVDLDDFSIASANREHGRAYQATSAFAFTRLLRKVDVPRQCGFVDFGCGRGRVLLLAADAGFERVVGIEFAAELAADARRNVERWTQTSARTCHLNVIEGDVLDYAVSKHDAVFFLFNPFDDVVLDGVLDRIEFSLDMNPREAWIIYHNPLEGTRIDRRPRFAKAGTHTVWGNDFSVYRSTP